MYRYGSYRYELKNALGEYANHKRTNHNKEYRVGVHRASRQSYSTILEGKNSSYAYVVEGCEDALTHMGYDL